MGLVAANPWYQDHCGVRAQYHQGAACLLEQGTGQLWFMDHFQAQVLLID